MNSNNRQFNLSRRNSLKFVAGAIGTGIIAARAGAELAAPEPVMAENPPNPDRALQLLIKGNERFVENKRKYPDQDWKRITEVAPSQAPFAAILGCADSRVPAEIVFDQGFGNIFVCRVAGNVATPEEIGSLEFAVVELGVKVILVLGHERCGAVKAAIEGGALPGHIGSLTEAIKPAVESSKNQPGDKVENAVKANVWLQANRLKASPVLYQLIQQSKLKIVGGYYDLDTGACTILPVPWQI
ncbi:carbonic anhydrase [Microcoleus sp. C2C3]|uniref:carbonic anhydrase n=1 Tax=unclassified Microcoleus TaxID=2642155 RepID=UPI002FCEA711